MSGSGLCGHADHVEEERGGCQQLKEEAERNCRQALSEGVLRRLKLNNQLVVQANGGEKRRQRNKDNSWTLGPPSRGLRPGGDER